MVDYKYFLKYWGIVIYLFFGLVLTGCNLLVESHSMLPTQVSTQRSVIETHTEVAANSYPVDTPDFQQETYPVELVEIIPSAETRVVDDELPGNGMCSLRGTLVSFSEKMAIIDTQFYFTGTVGNENQFPPILVKPDEKKGDIIDFSDRNGNFYIRSVPAGHYYLIVWSPNSWRVAIEEARPSFPIIVECKSRNIIDLGTVYFD